MSFPQLKYFLSSYNLYHLDIFFKSKHLTPGILWDLNVVQIFILVLIDDSLPVVFWYKHFLFFTVCGKKGSSLGGRWSCCLTCLRLRVKNASLLNGDTERDLRRKRLCLCLIARSATWRRLLLRCYARIDREKWSAYKSGQGPSTLK